jgi:FkbM family methyltransferase
MIKKIVKKTFNFVGLEIKKFNNKTVRFSQAGCIENLEKIGFSPSRIIDGGGAYGDFSLMASHYYPNAEFFIVEPLLEYKKVLEKNLKNLNTKIFYKALSDKKGSISINVHDDLVGSSLLEEVEDNNGKSREVGSIMLSDMINDEPTLIKLDLQGAEIIALSPCKEKLKQSKEIIVLCESSLFYSFKTEDNKIMDLIKFFDEIDYEIYDIYGAGYRPYDNALAQIDLIFTHKDSKLNKVNIYANKEDREEHNLRYKKRHKNMGII